MNCLSCGDAFVASRRGVKPKLYCSNNCRLAHHKLRAMGKRQLPSVKIWTRPQILDDEPLGYIYFVTADKPNYPIKIGFSETATGMLGRLQDLQTACPYGLYIIGYCRGSRTDETAFHNNWQDCRMQGEWFARRKALLNYIQSAEVRTLNG